MKDLKDKLNLIIEQSTYAKPACKNCISYSNGTCSFGCINERSGYAYRLNNNRLTTPDYSCDNFNSTYNFDEKTIDVMSDIVKDIERINEAKKNLELLLSGKITENDFVDLMN